MINKCNLKDIDRINELGNLINSNFSRLNDVEKLINEERIIGCYENDLLIGFVLFELNYEVLDILYIVVDPIYRNKGYASLLIDYILDNYVFDRIMLEVRCDNSNAIKLYKKYNFKIINVRKNYYDNMDGYVMEMIK